MNRRLHTQILLEVRKGRGMGVKRVHIGGRVGKCDYEVNNLNVKNIRRGSPCIEICRSTQCI